MADREEPEKTEAPPETDLAKEKEAAQELATEAKAEEDIPAVAVAPVAVGAETASTQAFDQPKQPGDVGHLEHGVHHWEQYKKQCEAANRPEMWKDQYRSGHTGAKGWVNPYEHQPFENRNAKTYDWSLEERTSASSALKDWFAGPTIADFRSIAVAKELDGLRSELGDRKFDELCGSTDEQADKKIPGSQRLRISAEAYGSDLVSKLREVAHEVDQGAREAEVSVPLIEPQPEEKKPVEDVSLMVEPEAAIETAKQEHV